MKQQLIDFLMGKQPQTAEVNPSFSYGSDVDNFINSLKQQPYMQKLYNAPIQERLSDEQIAQKVANGLNLGIPELSQAQKNIGIRIPQGAEQVAQAQAGEFNKPIMVAGVNNVPREGGLIQGYKQGYNLNYDNPTKTVGTRIGQGLGTLGRFADSPLGRGLIAYGLSNAMGDTNPLEQAFTAGVGRQNNMTRDKAYRQGLINMGVDEAQVNAIPGIVTDDIFKNYTLANYRNNMTNYRNLKLDKDTYLKQQQNIYKMLDLGVIDSKEATRQMLALNEEYDRQNPIKMQEGNKTVQGNKRLDIMKERNDIIRQLGGERNDITLELGRERNNISQQNADTYAKNTGKRKIEETDEYRQDLADYVNLINDPRQRKKVASFEALFAKKYGKLPPKVQ